MHPPHPASALRAPENVFKPRLVVTKGPEVVAHFEWSDNHQAHLFARHLAIDQRLAICLYEVDWRLPLPPPAGTIVDPQDYDWELVSCHQAEGLSAGASIAGSATR